MRDYLELLRRSRSHLGLTQARLSQLSGVSIPNIQLIEMGKANPSLATLQKLSKALHLKLSLSVPRANWNLLAYLGAALSGADLKHPPSPSELSKRLKDCLLKAGRELKERKTVSDRDRKTEALQALLLAIYTHYPEYYRRHCAPWPDLHGMLPDLNRIPAKLLKLRRISLTRLGDYL